MPAFEDEDIAKMSELMNEEARINFLAKRKKLVEKREREIKELEEMLICPVCEDDKIKLQEDDDGIFGQVDGS